MRRVAVAVVGCVALGACGATDVTESSEYVALLDQNAVLAADLDQIESDAAVAGDELEQLQAELADQQAGTERLRSDFQSVLSMIFRSQGGLDEEQSDCVGAAVVGDSDVRRAYLTLISATDLESDEAEAALSDLNDVLRGCGVDVADPDTGSDEAAAADLPAAMLAATRPVESTGVALPRLTATDISSDLAVGTAAPVLVGEGYDGETIRVDAVESGPIMLVFLAHWCPHCNAEMPRIQQLQEEGLIPDGVDVIAVSTGVDPDAPNFPPDVWLDEMNWTFPTLVDGIDIDSSVYIASDAFGVSGFPFVALIDADGNVAARWTGERSFDELATLLADTFGNS